jgi:shikimate kinase
VHRIFSEDGEVSFRRAEAAASAEVARRAPSVIAPGGGIVLNSAAMAHLLDSGRIIYLRATPDAAIRRMGRGITNRPLLAGAEDPHEAMRLIYKARRPVYEECAEMTVETGGIGRSTVITRVVELVLAAERDFVSEND